LHQQKNKKEEVGPNKREGAVQGKRNKKGKRRKSEEKQKGGGLKIPYAIKERTERTATGGPRCT